MEKDGLDLPNEHYEILQMDLMKRTLSRATQSPQMEDSAALRDFNSELLSRIGDFRKKNLELAKIENALRTELAKVEKRERERENELSEKYVSEIESLKRALDERTITAQQAREEWTRQITAFNDEKWERDLEIENLRKKDVENQETIARLMQQIATDGEKLKAEQQKATAAFDKLRGEYTNVDACYKQANDNVLQLQNEVHAITKRYEAALLQQQERLKAEFKAQHESVLSENTQLRSMLAVRDMKLENDRNQVQASKERLTFLDQHLGQLSDRLRRDKTELTKAAKAIADELHFALEHPFTEYLQIVEIELAQLEKQLQATSAMAPTRSKTEARVAQARSHRDSIKEILSGSESDLLKHADTVAAIIETLAKDTQIK